MNGVSKFERFDAGRWITIGGAEDEDGKSAGGSKVFVQNGRITKGHPSLTGKKLSNLDADAPKESRRKENQQGEGHAIAKISQEARKEGINPKHVNDLADDLLKHDAEFIGEHNQMLEFARQQAESEGGSLKGLALRVDKHGLDHPDVKGFDLVARRVAKQYPGYFPNPDDADQQLWDMLNAGPQPRMTKTQAHQRALDTLLEDKHSRPAPTTDDEVPFAEFAAKGPFQGTRGGTYWITESGDKTYDPPDDPQAKSGDDRTDEHRRKSQALESRKDEVPPSRMQRVKAWVATKYAALTERYGPTGAKLVMGGMIALLPIPIPGTSLLPIAIAEGVRGVKRLAVGHAEQFAELTADDLAEQIRAAIEDLYADSGEPAPEIDQEELLLVAEEMLANGDGT